MPNTILVFIPTYNERDNVMKLYERISNLRLPLDILFIDDNSPDGTGNVLDRINKPNVFVIHRSGKLGIGSAHKDGIAWAYSHEYAQTYHHGFRFPPQAGRHSGNDGAISKFRYCGNFQVYSERQPSGVAPVAKILDNFRGMQQQNCS